MKKTISINKNTWSKASIRKLRVTSDGLFIVAFCLYTATLLIESTTVTALLPQAILVAIKMLRYFSYLLCALKVLITAKYKRKCVLYAFILIVIVMVTVYTSDRTLAMLTFVFLGAVDAPKNEVISNSLRVQVIFLALTIISSLLGIIDNYLFDIYRGRWGLGFIWTTFAPILFMFIVFEYIYLYYSQTRLLHYVLFGVIATYLYTMTKTRFAYVVTMLFLIVSYSQRKIKKPWKIIRRMGKWNMLWPIIIAAFSIFIQLKYDGASALWQRVDLLLSRRLYYGLNAINKYKITAFGQKIEWIGRSYKTEMNGLIPSDDLIDNAYLRNLLLYGVIGLGSILSLYAIGIRRAVKHTDYLLVWIYIVILGFCVFEYWMYNLQMNPFALISVMSFSSSKKKTLSHT